MAENDFQRAKRDREFQAAVLTALASQQKRPSRWPVLESRIVNTLINTVLIGAIGATLAAYLSSAQQCRAEAEMRIEKHERLVSELRYREKEVRSAILAASSHDDLAKRFDVIATRAGSSEFQNRPMFSLRLELSRIYQLATTIHDDELQSDTSDVEQAIDVFYLGFANRDVSLEDLQVVAASEGEVKRRERQIPYLNQDCSTGSVLSRIFGTTSPILTANYSGF